MTRVICIELDATGRIKLFAIGNPDEMLVFYEPGSQESVPVREYQGAEYTSPHEPYQKLLRYFGDPGVMGFFKKTLKTRLEKRMNLHRSLRIHEYNTPYDGQPPQGLFRGTVGRRVFLY